MRLFLAAALLASPLAVACGGDDPAAKPTLEVGSFNAGLADGFVDFARERAPEVFAALPEQGLDVLCVQEVWTPEDWEDLVAASAEGLPNTYRLEDSQTFADTCEDGELDALEACVIAECDENDVEGLAACALELCADDLGGLSDTCTSCLLAQVGNTLADIKTTCESDEPVPVYAYGGSFGTGILSNLELTEQEALVFKSTANRRALLHARVDSAEAGPVHVFCTHLTANLTDVPYAGEADSWADEQATQIAEAIEWMEEKSAGEPYMLLGDVNTGPEKPGILAELPENYALLTDAGLVSAYAAGAAPLCTYCDGNPLNQDIAAGDGGLIDHIFTKMGDGLVLQAERFLDEPIEIQVEDAPTESRYSDHYGVRASVRK